MKESRDFGEEEKDLCAELLAKLEKGNFDLEKYLKQTVWQHN